MALFNLAGRVVEEIDLVCGGENCLLLPCVNDKLQKLRAVISVIGAVLADAEEQARTTLEVKFWVMRIGDVLHDAADLVARFRAETESVKIFRKVRSSPTQLVFGLKIRNVLERLDELGERRELLSLKEQRKTFETGMGRRLETHSFVDVTSIFGREDDKEKIVKMLFDFKQDDVSVLPIVGTAGVGKTTLAKLVFNDERVRMQFEYLAWICVADRFDIEFIMRTLLESLGADLGPANLEILIGRVRDMIYGKRYLIVLDDVWCEEGDKWKYLMEVLTAGAEKMSRIIVTTRSQKVVEQIRGAMDYQYELRALDEDASWSLFKQIITEDGRDPVDATTTGVAKRLLRRCGGNPLAIRALALMLWFREPEEWLALEHSEQLQFQHQSDILEALRLSYNQLPSHQKECFAYCRLFPKGYEIDVKTLVNFWISQGFVRSSGSDLEDNAYADFVDLLQRSFFHEPKTDEWGSVTKCKMPNLMHDLAISAAAESRFATLELRNEEKRCDAETHHVSFNSHLDSPWQIPSDLFEAKRIQTIVLFRQSHWEVKGRPSDSICDVIASRFKFVRTLDMNNSGIKVVPDSIGELKLLKYLDLSRNKDIKVLPKSFSGLQNLHTLKLNDCGRLQELPRDIKKLVKLRNLEIDSCYSLTHMPCGLGQLTYLRTLSEFVLSRGNGSKSRRTGELDELAKLNNLRGKLIVKSLRPGRNSSTTQLKEGEDKDVPAEVLKHKLHLRSVTLIWDTVVTSDTDERKASGYKLSLDDLEPHLEVQDLSLSAYGGTVFSEWLPLHVNLVNLSLSKCWSCSNIPLLNRLTQLKVLVLDDMANLEYFSDNVENSSVAIYSSLKELRLTNLPKLDRWWKVTGGLEEMKFPCLSKLSVEDCPNLNSMPLFPSLDELLLLKNTRWEPFQQTIRRRQVPSQTTAEASSSSTSSNLNTEYPLSKLRTLCIIQMSNADTDMWQYLRSLHSLTFDHLSNVETLLEGLQHVTSLQELHIWRCDSLNKITSWISGLTSLRKLSIRLCPNLTISPDQIGLITSLKNVEIKDCPEIVHVENLLKDRLFKR